MRIEYVTTSTGPAPADGHALANQDGSAKWCQLFPIGVVKHRADFPNGKIVFDTKFLTSMVNNWLEEGSPQRAINYFHRGTSDGDATPISEKIAAGWIQGLQLREDGLWALIAWTEKARGFILADELRYLSPEFTTDGLNKATGKRQGPTLLGAALLNDPYLTELPRVAASEKPEAEPSAIGARMDKKQLCDALGLAEDVADEEVTKAIAELVEAKNASALSATETATKLGELESSTVTLTEKLSASEKRVAELESEKRTAEVKSFVDGLVKAGKVTPAIRENVEAIGLSSGVDAIKFFEKAVPAVSMTEIGVPAGSNGDPKKEALQRFDAKVAELQGKGMKFAEAYSAARQALPEDFIQAFSS